MLRFDPDSFLVTSIPSSKVSSQPSLPLLITTFRVDRFLENDRWGRLNPDGRHTAVESSHRIGPAVHHT